MENRLLLATQRPSFIMKYDPRNPEPDYNTLKVGLLGLGMAAVLVKFFLLIMIPLFHAVKLPMR
jgi:hypothetical protein